MIHTLPTAFWLRWFCRLDAVTRYACRACVRYGWFCLRYGCLVYVTFPRLVYLPRLRLFPGYAVRYRSAFCHVVGLLPRCALLVPTVTLPHVPTPVGLRSLHGCLDYTRLHVARLRLHTLPHGYATVAVAFGYLRLVVTVLPHFVTPHVYVVRFWFCFTGAHTAFGSACGSGWIIRMPDCGYRVCYHTVYTRTWITTHIHTTTPPLRFAHAFAVCCGCRYAPRLRTRVRLLVLRWFVYHVYAVVR